MIAVAASDLAMQLKSFIAYMMQGNQGIYTEVPFARVDLITLC